MIVERWLVRSVREPRNVLVFDHDPTDEKVSRENAVAVVADSDMEGLFGFFPVDSAVYPLIIAGD